MQVQKSEKAIPPGKIYVMDTGCRSKSSIDNIKFIETYHYMSAFA